MTQKFPLQWPEGWPRSKSRKSGKFGKTTTIHRGADVGGDYQSRGDITMSDSVKRLNYELERLGVNVLDDSLISTNLKLNMSGLPRQDQGEPGDPGVAVYFQKKGGPMRVVAIDAYYRVRDNVAAIAATLEAMRAIERHGGAQILERAFTGFDALPPPDDYRTLGLGKGASRAAIEAAFKNLARQHHPDVAGGNADTFALISAARDRLLDQVTQ